MKKILTSLLTALAVLCLTACTNSNFKENADTPSQPPIIISSETPKDENTSKIIDSDKNVETEDNIIANLEFLKKDMKYYDDFIKSPLLKKAIEEKAIILFNGEIVTSAYDNPVGYNNGAIEFLREAYCKKNKKNASIKLYSFYVLFNGKKTASSQKNYIN